MRSTAVLLILLSWSLPAGAAELRHTVRFGESASAIARQYYGDFSHTDLILRFNDRAGADLRPGERLLIPYSVDHRIAAGDNGSTLAKRYLGRASAWDAVARLNGLDPVTTLPVGRTISIPVILRHTLARGESLAALAAAYYDDPRRSSLLQGFNRIDDPRGLSVGSVVEVPLVGIRLKPGAGRPTPESAARPGSEIADNAPAPVTEPAPVNVEAPVPDWFAGAYSSADAAYRRGDYAAAHDLVAGILERVDALPRGAELARLWQLSAFIEVAFDRGEQACGAFEAMRLAGPPVELDPERVSPKILAALAACSS